ncbi:hypothetical protein FOZ63_013442, partial [Perkinsus olseni]
ATIALRPRRTPTELSVVIHLCSRITTTTTKTMMMMTLISSLLLTISSVIEMCQVYITLMCRQAPSVDPWRLLIRSQPHQWAMILLSLLLVSTRIASILDHSQRPGL